MTFEDIFETLKFSVDYEEFLITYNELIPDIVKAKNNTSLEDWQKFMEGKNNLKKDLYWQYKQEYPIAFIRSLRLAKYVYDININEIIEDMLQHCKKLIKFNKLFK